MSAEKQIMFQEGHIHKMKWFLSVSSPDDLVQCQVYLTPKEARKLFDLMKEAGF